MAARHERRHFLVPRLDEVDLVFGTIQGSQETVDSVARIAINAAHAPLTESVHDKIADGFCHGLGGLSRAAARYAVADAASVPCPHFGRAKGNAAFAPSTLRNPYRRACKFFRGWKLNGFSRRVRSAVRAVASKSRCLLRWSSAPAPPDVRRAGALRPRRSSPQPAFRSARRTPSVRQARPDR